MPFPSAGRKLTRPLRARLLPAIGVMIAAVAALAATSVPGAARAATLLPVSYDFITAATTNTDPTTPPPGANNWSCKPSAEHPYPVVLVHGTAANMDDDMQAESPTLVNHGYCVFAFNYGASSPTSLIQGTGDITASAATMSTFVDQVLAATGASKVDVVGHSEGGMMPRYYINFLGGAQKVHTLVGLAPSNYGAGTASSASTSDAGTGLISGICDACTEQEAGSAFLANLNATPTVSGVNYTVIETKDDEIVSPYTNAYLPAAPNVTNITLQDQCSQDYSDHLEIGSDPVAMADMLNALDPANPVTVPCLLVLPVFGPTGTVPAF
jgi:triacylglycerol esterase/lipase EstA (alpha/beta hydrolase family)